MKIPLTQNQFAIVDDDDYEELAKHKWCAYWCSHTRSYYAVRGIRLSNGKWTTEKMHRRLLGLKRGDRHQGDHINHATLDNRRSNLRVVSVSENHQNNRRAKGYYWHNRDQKYHARIAVDGTKTSLGYHDTPQEARAAYLAAKHIYHPSAPLHIPAG